MKIIAGINSWDQKLSRFFQSYYRKSWLKNCMKVISVFASGVFCFPIYAALYFLMSNERHMLASIIAGECVQLPVIISLRLLVQRPRPFNGNYFSKWNSYSFPSLHSSRAFMLSAIIYSFYGESLTMTWVWPAAGCIALSRLVLQKHYVSDVICGSIIGFIVSATLKLFF